MEPHWFPQEACFSFCLRCSFRLQGLWVGSLIVKRYTVFPFLKKTKKKKTMWTQCFERWLHVQYLQLRIGLQQLENVWGFMLEWNAKILQALLLVFLVNKNIKGRNSCDPKQSLKFFTDCSVFTLVSCSYQLGLPWTTSYHKDIDAAVL